MSKKAVTQIDPKQWVSNYRAIRSTHEKFCEKLKVLLDDLLSKKTIKYQVVEARAKSIDSFAQKLQREGKTYTDPLREITDLSGLRIIVYYLDDVDKVCTMLQNEFRVDDSRSVDKRALLAADQFGYLSVHKIISLSDSRAQLPEWSSFRDLVAEVQVRTVLQHAWAAISHTLQYKRETDIPYQLRRKLIRLSGLLELADEQFFTLRRKQEVLEKKITRQIVERDLDIEINVLTVREFISRSDIAHEIVKIARDVGIIEAKMNEGYSQLVTACAMNGIREIRTLEEQLASFKPKAESFFKRFVRKRSRLGRVAGTPENVLTIIIIGAHREKFTAKDVQSKLGWWRDYAIDVLDAGQVFEDTL